MRRRPQHLTLALIALLHLGLLLVVLTKPKAPPEGRVSYMQLLRIVPAKPAALPVAPAKLAPPINRPTTRLAKVPAATVAAASTPPAATRSAVAAAAIPESSADGAPESALLESAAPDFAAAAPALDIDKMRRQAAVNDRDRVKTTVDKATEQELRRKSIETAVAAAAKAGARKDCQNGYSGIGILAIFPILYGTVTDNGCKWK